MMHTGGLTLFLVGVAVIGLAPFLFLTVYLARRFRDGRGEGEASGGEAVGGGVGWIRILSVGLAGIAVLAVAAAWYLSAAGGNASVPQGAADMGGMRMGGSQGQVSPQVLPSTLVGMSMTGGATGEEALRQVAQLHGTEFPMSFAEVARYGDGRATVWVSGSADAATASTMAEQMAARIAEGTSPFDPPRALADERGVWVTHGMGQVHYFFARGDAVWWLSADRGIARRALSEILEVAT